MEMNNESIMVCVHYGPHGQRLIQRGGQLAKLLNAPLIVLTVDASGDNEYNREKQQYLSGWEKQTQEAGGQFVIRKCNGKKTADVIVETAKDNKITQIVLGQSSQTLWQEITREASSMSCWSGWDRLIFISLRCSDIRSCSKSPMSKDSLRI